MTFIHRRSVGFFGARGADFHLAPPKILTQHFNIFGRLYLFFVKMGVPKCQLTILFLRNRLKLFYKTVGANFVLLVGIIGAPSNPAIGAVCPSRSPYLRPWFYYKVFDVLFLSFVCQLDPAPDTYTQGWVQDLLGRDRDQD